MKCFANCQKTSQMSTVNQKRRWRPTLKRRRESGRGRAAEHCQILGASKIQKTVYHFFFFLFPPSQSSQSASGLIEALRFGLQLDRQVINNSIFPTQKKRKVKENAGEKRKCRPASYYNLIVLQFSLAPINIFCVFVHHTWCNSQKNLRMADYPDSNSNNKYNNNNEYNNN